MTMVCAHSDVYALFNHDYCFEYFKLICLVYIT